MLSFISYNEIVDSQTKFLAHFKDNREEFLEDHIQTCQKYFQEMYDDKDIENIICRFNQKLSFQNVSASFEFIKELFVGLITFHDFGKINPIFQETKMNNYIDEAYEGLDKSQHSYLSSIIYIDYYLYKLEIDENFVDEEKHVLERLIVEHAYLIARHHSNLESLALFIHQLTNSQSIYLIQHLLSKPLKGYKGLKFLDDNKLRQLIRYLYYDQEYLQEEASQRYFYYRLAYSLLVASDYYATTEFMNQKRMTTIEKIFSIKDFQEEYNQNKLIKNIRMYEQNKYQGFHKNLESIQDINELRSELFLDAEKKLLDNPNELLYFLEAPTGSGKSNTAFNLSFQLMQNGKKLFYIYPFNTLVEQNKQNLNQLFPKKSFQDQIVVVNSLTPLFDKVRDKEDSQFYYQKLLLDRQFLNYSIILSTHVSFFNLLFGSDKESVIGFHQLSNAIIVLDEIQSYKNQIWSEMIMMLKSCAELMGMKFIIMSATLPNLEELSQQKNCVRYLVPRSQEYFQHPLFKNRVKIHYELLEEKINLQILKEHLIRNQKGDKKILIEFIKKDTAYQFYKMLLEDENIYLDVKYLTGDDSLIERERILKPIKENKCLGLILVATQIVEAGVDIDMDIGYKDISLLDCEEQFLGRINRSCKRKGDVYFFDLDKYQMIYRGDFRANDSLTLKNKKMQDVLLNKDFYSYYRKVMQILQINRNQSSNENGLDYFFKNFIYKLDFPKIKERMKLIDDNLWSMDVVLCRKLEMDDGTIIDGWEIWNDYKELLQNNEMNYAEKRVKLIEVRSQLNYFVYTFKNNIDFPYNDIIGELRCVEDASQYFINGKLNREKIGKLTYDFI